MNTDLLTLTQWLSPAFPLGSYAYSHGLETAISVGAICDEATLEAWLRVIIAKGAGRNDAVLLAASRRGEDVQATARALAGSKERLEEAMAQGAAFAGTLRAMGHHISDAVLPVALGEASRALELETHEISALYLHSFTSNLISCAVRFVPLGQTAGQRVLARLSPLIAQVAQETEAAGLDDLSGGAFMSDISAMQHESQHARVFRT